MALIFISEKTGYFQLPDKEKKVITDLTPEELDEAVGEILKSGFSCMEDSSQIANPAEKIMFEQLNMAFKELSESRGSILSEIDLKFAEAERKYLAQ